MIKMETHRIYWQVFLWSCSWLLVSFILSNRFDNPQFLYKKTTPDLIGIIIIVLINVQFLLPKFYFKKQIGIFILAGFTSILLVNTLIHHEIFPWSEWFYFKPRGIHLDESIWKSREGAIKLRRMTNMMPLVISFLGTTLLEIAHFANRKEKEAIRSEKEKLETELKFLKSQINPHFLFNTLNNIYSLTVVQSPKSSESVMQLSEILRYMVYDATAEKVPLKSEINYIENYVELKLLKDSRGMNVTMNLDNSNPNLMVAPLLFIPFVENAFKHSRIENLKDGFIDIKLEFQDNELIFKVKNSIFKNKFTKDKMGGVGLENIKKRLNLLYLNNQHHLTINHSDYEFDVCLKLVIV